MLNAGAWAPITAWGMSRLSLARFLPLAGLIAWAAASHGDRAVEETVIRWPLAFLLVTQFRLWDDIVDRARDRLHHPDRVLPRVNAIGGFILLCAALGVTNVASIAMLIGGPSAIGLLLLHALLAAWYRSKSERDLWHTHILILKYPAFVLILAGEQAPLAAAASSAALVYVGMCAFELLQRRRESGGRRADGTLVVLHASALSVLPAVHLPSMAAYLVCLGNLFALGIAAFYGNGSRYAAYVPFGAVAAALYTIKGGGA